MAEPAGHMGYWRLRRTRVVLAAFVVFALLMWLFPTLDLRISSLFFDGRAFRDWWWQELLKEALGYLIAGSFVAVVGIYACNRLLGQNIGKVDGRRVLYLLLVAIVGAGLIVNFALKNHVGRARPRDVVEFGGTKHFTRPFVVSQECRTNCSFSSGDVAGAFFSIALARALTRRRRYLGAALAFGALVAFSRVASGAHFFSDAVVSFFVMLIVADVLWYYVVLTRRERNEMGIVAGACKAA